MGVLQVCGEGLGAAPLAVCWVNIYRARGSAHPQFGAQVQGTAGDMSDLQCTSGMKGNKKAQPCALHSTSVGAVCLSVL